MLRSLQMLHSAQSLASHQTLSTLNTTRYLSIAAYYDVVVDHAASADMKHISAQQTSGNSALRANQRKVITMPNVLWRCSCKHRRASCLAGERPDHRALRTCPAAPRCLTAEAIQCAALPLERVDHIHGCHGLPAGVLLQEGGCQTAGTKTATQSGRATENG